MEITSQSLAQSYSQKSDEELELLHQQGTLTSIAYDVIEAEMKRRGIDVPDRRTSDEADIAAEREFRRLTLKAHWAGQAPLASAYWLLGTLGG